jgi:hypothetical protein
MAGAGAWDEASDLGSQDSGVLSQQSDFDPTRSKGSNLEEATLEFLNETKAARRLEVAAGQSQLTTMEFIDYLGINIALEPELVWVAREMCAAPMPPNAEMLVSKSNIVYFHDLENDYYTIEHPLTQRYLKALERARLDQLALRTKPSVNALVFAQPEILFNAQYRNLQVPCQDCGVMQATLKCNQCVMSFCNACYSNLHDHCEGPRKNHTTVATGAGSYCSAIPTKKPQVYCANCEDFFSYEAFEQLHKKGQRRNHRVMMISVSDAEMVEPHVKCEECEDNQASFRCDQCMDYFCIACFWRAHMNGERRKHTVTKVTLNPLCNQCNATRATVFNEQSQELYCTDCFTLMHFKGNRMLHLFMDASNILLLLERLDPGFQEHMRRARPRVLWAITSLQGWVRGLESRKTYRRHKQLVTKIQQRWRGAMTRRKLLGMLDQYKWRRKEINNFFLPKTRQERLVAKQRFASQHGRKDVAHKATHDTLRELRDTITKSAQHFPLEDKDRTRDMMEKSAAEMTQPGSNAQDKYVLPIYSSGGGGRASTNAAANLEDRMPKKKAEETGVGQRMATDAAQRSMELTRKDVRGAGDVSLRQMLRIDDRVEADPQKYQTDQPVAATIDDKWGTEARLRDQRYRG